MRWYVCVSGTGVRSFIEEVVSPTTDATIVRTYTSPKKIQNRLPLPRTVKSQQPSNSYWKESSTCPTCEYRRALNAEPVNIDTSKYHRFLRFNEPESSNESGRRSWYTRSMTMENPNISEETTQNSLKDVRTRASSDEHGDSRPRIVSTAVPAITAAASSISATK
jgi:hypothetical protein